MNIAQTLRKIENELSLLRLIRREGRISQADLSLKTGCQPSTVSNLVRGLRSLGLIVTAGKGISGPNGGKRTDLLSLDARFGIFAGIEVRTSGITAAYTDFSGIVLDRRVREFPERNEEALLDLLKEEVFYAEARWGDGYKGVGFAVPSVVDGNGDILPSEGFDWEIRGFMRKVRAIVPEGVSVVLENDANCSALYAYSFFRSKFDNFITFLLHPERSSLGSGIFLEGKLFRGVHGAAGELAGLHGSGGFSVENVTDRVVSAAALLDCEAVIVSGDMDSDSGRTYIQDIMSKLSALNRRITLGVIPDVDIAVTGAAFLAVNVHTENALKRKGGIS